MKKVVLLSFRNLLEMLYLTKEVLLTILNLVVMYVLLLNIAVLSIHRFILKFLFTDFEMLTPVSLPLSVI